MPFSTPAKKPFGTEPPTTRSAKTTPPSGFGSSSSQTSPNIPWPPVCFLYRPWTWVVPRIVSLYGTRGVWVAMAAPNLRLSRSMMTAVWASPIVRRTCSPMGERSRRTVGSSSSIRASAGPILSRSPFETGSIATTSDGAGNSSGGSVSGAAWADSVSPVSVTVSLATAPISPAFSSPIGSCSLPCSSSSWPIRSSAPCVAFQMWAWEWSVPRQDPQVRQPADERIRGRLEDADQERAVLVGCDLDGVAGLVRGLDRRLVGRRGEVPHDRIEQAAQADPLGRAPEQHRRQDRLLHALAQAGLEFRVADRLALEVLREDVVIGLRGGLEELVAPASRPHRRGRPGSGPRPRSCRPTRRPCCGRGPRSP